MIIILRHTIMNQLIWLKVFMMFQIICKLVLSTIEINTILCYLVDLNHQETTSKIKIVILRQKNLNQRILLKLFMMFQIMSKLFLSSIKVKTAFFLYCATW